jgi:hypothetical protein
MPVTARTLVRFLRLPAQRSPSVPSRDQRERLRQANEFAASRSAAPGRWWIRHQRHPQAQHHEHHETMRNPHKVLSFGSPVRAGDRLPKHLEITAPRALVILHPLNLEPAPASPALVVAVYGPRGRVVHEIAPEFSDFLRQHISLCFVTRRVAVRRLKENGHCRRSLLQAPYHAGSRRSGQPLDPASY